MHSRDKNGNYTAESGHGRQHGSGQLVRLRFLNPQNIDFVWKGQNTEQIKLAFEYMERDEDIEDSSYPWLEASYSYESPTYILTLESFPEEDLVRMQLSLFTTEHHWLYSGTAEVQGHEARKLRRYLEEAERNESFENFKSIDSLVNFHRPEFPNKLSEGKGAD